MVYIDTHIHNTDTNIQKYTQTHITHKCTDKHNTRRHKQINKHPHVNLIQMARSIFQF